MAIQATASGLNLLGGANMAAAPSGERQKRESSKVWVNVGYYVDVPQPDGSAKRTFVSLALGIPAEDIKVLEVKGNASPEWKNLVAAKNQLREEVLRVGMAQAPGSHIPAPKLCVEITRVNEIDTTVVDSGTNPYSMANAISL